MKQVHIELTSTKDADLIAILHNPTDRDIVVFHDPGLNPTELWLAEGRRGELRQPIEGKDERARMKFDRTIKKSMFKKVPAGGQYILEEAFFRPQTDGTFSLQWGHFLYGGLKPGWHRVQLTYNNSESGLVPEAWKGQLRAGGYVLPELGIRSPAHMALEEVVESSSLICVTTKDFYRGSVNPAQDPFQWTAFKWIDVLKGGVLPGTTHEISLPGAENTSAPRYRSTLSPIRFGELAQDSHKCRPFILFLNVRETVFPGLDQKNVELLLTCPGAWESIDQKAAIQDLLKKK